MQRVPPLPLRCQLTEDGAVAGEKRPRDPSDAEAAPSAGKLAATGEDGADLVDLLRATIASITKLRAACEKNHAIAPEVEAAIIPLEHNAAAYERIRDIQARLAP